MGHAEVRWSGGRAPEVRAAHPDCPEINGLNARAAALYARLGYLPTMVYLDPRAHVDAEGVLHEYAERCRFLVKKLR